MWITAYLFPQTWTGSLEHRPFFDSIKHLLKKSTLNWGTLGSKSRQKYPTLVHDSTACWSFPFPHELIQGLSKSLQSYKLLSNSYRRPFAELWFLVKVALTQSTPTQQIVRRKWYLLEQSAQCFWQIDQCLVYFGTLLWLYLRRSVDCMSHIGHTGIV